MSTDPKPVEYKSAQYEFTEEQNKTINSLADNMKVSSNLLLIVGLAFVVFAALSLLHATQDKGSYGPPIGLGAAALLCLSIGFWTSSAAHSFRRIVETKNEDIWHLMNALDKLLNMYALLKTIVIGCLVLIVVGVAVAFYNATKG